MKIFNKVSVAVLVVAFTLVLTGASVAFAETAPPLGSILTNDFVILGETGITNTEDHTSVIIGNIGNSPGTAAQMDNVFCSEITGTIYGADDAYTGDGTDRSCFSGTAESITLVGDAVADMVTAYNDAANGTSHPVTEVADTRSATIGIDPIYATFEPGVYKWTTGLTIAGDITLHGGPDDIFIFQIAQDLNVAAGGSIAEGVHILLTGGAKASNVFWAVGGTGEPGAGVVLGSYSTFNGIILSAKAITMGAGAVLNGRALAQTTVTLIGNNAASLLTTTLTLVKTISGGTRTVADFPLTATGATTTITGVSGTADVTDQTVDPGTYTLSEGTQSDYTAGTWSCTNDITVNSSQITLGSGATTTCTIINTYIAPVVTSTSRHSGGGGIHYGCKDLNALNYEYFAASKPALCLYSATSTPVVYLPVSTTTVIIPRLPNTGISDGTNLTKEEAVATFYRSLSIGSHGGDVTTLQTALLQKGLLVIPSGVAKGYFGILTQTAISKYQTRSDLPSVGIFGPLTKAKLISESSE